MRVRISYGVEIEEIPEQVSNLGYSAEVSMKEAMDMVQKAMDLVDESEKDFETSVKLLEKARLKLNNADLIIADSQAILEGLSNYYKEEQNVSEGRLTMDSSRSDIAQTENT